MLELQEQKTVQQSEILAKMTDLLTVLFYFVSRLQKIWVNWAVWNILLHVISQK